MPKQYRSAGGSLSLGERVRVRDRLVLPWVRASAERRSQLPLPRGEGRGEGQTGTSRFVAVPSPSGCGDAVLSPRTEPASLSVKDKLFTKCHRLRRQWSEPATSGRQTHDIDFNNGRADPPSPSGRGSG